MKKLYLLFLLGFSFQLQAQSFSVEVADTTLYGMPGDYTFYGDIDLFNNNGTGFNMGWERIEESVPAGWTTSNCDPHVCHGVGVTSGTFILPTLPSGMNTHFYPDGVAGSGYLKIKLWRTSNPADSTILTYYGVAGTVSVDEIQASDIQVFPSPARQVLNVMFPGTGAPVEVAIVNTLGQRVAQHTLDTGLYHPLQVGGLEPGVYWVQFTFDGGKQLVRKMVKG